MALKLKTGDLTRVRKFAPVVSHSRREAGTLSLLKADRGDRSGGAGTAAVVGRSRPLHSGSLTLT